MSQERRDEQATPAEVQPLEEFAREVRINQITGGELWVSLIGTVISRNAADSSMVVDDGTGQIVAKAPRLPEAGSLVRVVARPFVSGTRPMLEAVIVQDFSGFDVELYRKVLVLEERVFSQEGDSHR